MAKKDKVVTHLVCQECKERNYSQVLSGKRSIGSLVLNKFCQRCREHQKHKEAK